MSGIWMNGQPTMTETTAASVSRPRVRVCKHCGRTLELSTDDGPTSEFTQAWACPAGHDQKEWRDTTSS